LYCELDGVGCHGDERVGDITLLLALEASRSLEASLFKAQTKELTTKTATTLAIVIFKKPRFSGLLLAVELLFPPDITPIACNFSTIFLLLSSFSTLSLLFAFTFLIAVVDFLSVFDFTSASTFSSASVFCFHHSYQILPISTIT